MTKTINVYILDDQMLDVENIKAHLDGIQNYNRDVKFVFSQKGEEFKGIHHRKMIKKIKAEDQNLVFLDLSMPAGIIDKRYGHYGGLFIFDELRGIFENIPVCFYTNCSATDVPFGKTKHHADSETTQLIQKGFSNVSTFVTAINRLLNTHLVDPKK